MTRYRIDVELPEDDPSEVLDRVIELSGDEEASVEVLSEEPLIPGPATPAERGAASIETTPEEWKQGAEALAAEIAERKNQ